MRQDSLIRHIWARHQYAVMARSRSMHDRICALVSSDPPLVSDSLELMAEALTNPPTRSGWTDTLERLWNQLKGAARSEKIAKGDFMATCKKGREEARRLIFHLAAAGDNKDLVGSSLLDDAPMPGFAFYKKGDDWWQVREKNGHLSSLPLSGLLNRASSSARRDAVLAGEGILRKIGGAVYPDPRFVRTLRSKGVWSESWDQISES